MDSKAYWTKELQLKCQTGQTLDEYLEWIRRVHGNFDVDKYAPPDPQLVVDVGGGLYGGALLLYKGGKRRMLVDYCVDEYIKLKTLPDDVEARRADFRDLSILADNSVDVLFAYEVLDHAHDIFHFDKGQAELCRILSPTGVMFFQHRLRHKPIIYHPVNVTEEGALKGFSSLKCISNIRIGRELYLTLKK